MHFVTYHMLARSCQGQAQTSAKYELITEFPATKDEPLSGRSDGAAIGDGRANAKFTHAPMAIFEFGQRPVSFRSCK